MLFNCAIAVHEQHPHAIKAISGSSGAEPRKCRRPDGPRGANGKVVNTVIIEVANVGDRCSKLTIKVQFGIQAAFGAVDFDGRN